MSKIIYVNLKEIISKIDLNRLSRDYQKYPLDLSKGTKSEIIPYNDIYYLYIELNLSYKEIQLYFNFGETKLKRILKNYNIKKDKSLLRQNQINGCIQHFGTTNSSQSPIIKEKIKKTKIQKYGNAFGNFNKIKQTKLEKYGDENFVNLEKAQETNLQKYGFKCSLSNPEIRQKAFHSKTRNNTHRSSKEEDKIFEILLTKFPNAIHHPIPSEKYPFQCDFYIPELDLYIEYQGDWTHGRNPYHEPFKASHKGHLEMVKLWISKETSYYNSVIKTWTFKDPLKRQTAWLNKLNWIEFFNIKQFMEWFNKQ